MSEDLAIDVGLTADSKEFKSFVDEVDSILEYGCTSMADRVVRDIVDKCHTSELDLAQDVIRACAAKTTTNYRTTEQWWETYKPTTGQRRQYHDRHESPQRKRPRSPSFRRQRPPTPSHSHYNEPRNDHNSPPYGRNDSRETRNNSRNVRNNRNGGNNPRKGRDNPRKNPRNGRTTRPEQRRRPDRRPMNLSFERPNTVRSRGHQRGWSRDERRSGHPSEPRIEHNRKRPMSPLFDNNSDVPAWPTSKRRKQR